MLPELRQIVLSYLPENPEDVIHGSFHIIEKEGIIGISDFVHQHFYFQHKLHDIVKNKDFQRYCSNVMIAIRCYIYSKLQSMFDSYTSSNKKNHMWLLSIMHLLTYEDECPMMQAAMITAINHIADMMYLDEQSWDQNKIRELYEYPYYFYIHGMPPPGGLFKGARDSVYSLCVSKNGGIYRRYVRIHWKTPRCIKELLSVK